MVAGAVFSRVHRRERSLCDRLSYENEWVYRLSSILPALSAWQPGCRTSAGLISGGGIMRVAEIMARDVITIPGDATVVEAAELMRRHNIGFLPVVTANMLVGVVTDRDIVVRGLGEGRNPYTTLVRSVVSTEPVWCYD